MLGEVCKEVSGGWRGVGGFKRCLERCQMIGEVFGEVLGGWRGVECLERFWMVVCCCVSFFAMAGVFFSRPNHLGIGSGDFFCWGCQSSRNSIQFDWLIVTSAGVWLKSGDGSDLDH